MADRWPAATGNWSTAANWNGGTLPVAGDVVWADGKTITIDQNVDLSPGGSINTGTRSGGTTGGGFLATAARTLKFAINAGSTVCLTTSHTTGTVAISGAVTAGASSSAYGVDVESVGSVSITGAVSGGSAGSTFGVLIGAVSANVTIVGNCVGGSVSSAHAVNVSGGNATLSITGNVTGSATVAVNGVNLNASGSSITVNGNVTGGGISSASGILATSSAATGTVTVTGTVTGGGGGAVGITWAGTATLNVVGNCVGSSGSSSTNGVNVTGAGTVNITGTAIPDNAIGSAGVIVTGAGATVRLTRAKGSGYGVGSSGVVQAPGLVVNAQSSVYVEELEFGARGCCPVSGPIYITPVSTNVAIFRKSGLSQLTLARSDNSATYGSPAASDVRNGVSYALGNLTGTAYIPAAGSVDLGVPVDATTGTAVLTAASVRTAIGLASANLDTQLAALPTTTTVNAIKTKTDNLPAAPASTTNITAASGVSLAADQHVIVDSGTVTNLTNAPSSVTPAQVWAALTSDLTTAGSIGERLKNAATVDTTGAQLAALS